MNNKTSARGSSAVALAKADGSRSSALKLVFAAFVIVLFGLGIFVGMNMRMAKKSMGVITEQACAELAEKINWMTIGIKNANNPVERSKEVVELKRFYADTCSQFESQPKKPELVKKLPEKNCEAIEKILLQSVSPDSESASYHERLYIAKAYAKAAERGCPENKEKYKALALRELEIARALEDDKFRNEYDNIDIIELYKKIDMKREAEKFFEKAKKLTDPAIDFIIQVQKIIDE